MNPVLPPAAAILIECAMCERTRSKKMCSLSLALWAWFIGGVSRSLTAGNGFVRTITHSILW